eukprot:6459472-Amphidinium_carterae.1
MRKMGKDLALKEQLAPKTIFTSKPYKMEGKQAKASTLSAVATREGTSTTAHELAKTLAWDRPPKPPNFN